MKREIFVLALLFVFCKNCISQVGIDAGHYSYSSESYSESITLYTNGQFNWRLNTEFLKLFVSGNWQVRDDSLILDSYPQKEKLLVWESIKLKTSNSIFYVANKLKEPIKYTFFGITNKNDTIMLRNQWKETVLSNRIKCFYIKDSKGLVSPVYCLKGEKANRVYIYFETTRIFENENWQISDKKIVPKGIDGFFQKYSLKKNDR